MRKNLLIKKIVDMTLSLIFFGIIIPLFVIIAISIKLNSPGPVFFRQTRIGKDGKPFILYKFRTMHNDCEAYAVSPKHNPNDPRITGLGMYLRKTGLDELPQLINVIKGDMSLVGPRPEMPFIVAEYTQDQMFRLGALPGLTGLWQISHHRSEPIHDNLFYDRYYIQNQSLSLDIWIIIQTIHITLKNIIRTFRCLLIRT